MTEDTDATTLGMRPADDPAGARAGVPGPADGLVTSDVVTLRDALLDWTQVRHQDLMRVELDDFEAAVRAEVAALRAAVVEWSEAADIASCTPGCDDPAAIAREYVAIQRLRALVGEPHNAAAFAAQPAAPEALDPVQDEFQRASARLHAPAPEAEPERGPLECFCGTSSYCNCGARPFTPASR